MAFITVIMYGVCLGTGYTIVREVWEWVKRKWHEWTNPPEVVEPAVVLVHPTHPSRSGGG